jgi:heavy metal translocating P-type ATPase
MHVLKSYWTVVFAAVILVVGLALYGLGQTNIANLVFGMGSVVGALPLARGMIMSLRHGRLGVDLLAIVAIAAALALGEYLAAAVITLMLTGGDALERYAQNQAKTELTNLLRQAPTQAHRYTDDHLQDVPVEQVKTHDRLLVKPGEVVPVDATVAEGVSSLDEAAITGESLPVEKQPGSTILSGSVNLDSALTVAALRPSRESQYQQIVALVREAAASKAPLVRLADQYSVPFTIIAFVIAGAAWAVSGLPLRALEVLVVATPCPLLLATPVALVSGMGRAARSGIIMKSGTALERLARVRAMAFDKTGTLTEARPAVTAVVPAAGGDEAELLRLAASVEQESGHILAAAVVAEAQAHKIRLADPGALEEVPGRGIRAQLGTQEVLAGKRSWLESEGVDMPREIDHTGETIMYVAVNGRYSGRIALADPVRPEALATLQELRRLGITQTMMLTGDHRPAAQAIAHDLGFAKVKSELLPADKVEAIKKLPQTWRPVAMVGDGVNDAPTLAAADVGVAMGAQGSTAASESADVVVMLDDLGRVAAGVQIAQRTLSIARQSIWVGIGLSIVLMLVASTGLIAPVYGALLQEAIDVSVIFNALRAHA